MSRLHTIMASLLLFGLCSAGPALVQVRHLAETAIPVRHLAETAVPVRNLAEIAVPVRHFAETAGPVRHLVETAVPVRHLAEIAVPIEQLSPQPYEFGFEFADGLGMSQHRREVADGTGTVRGSYGYLDALGVNRIVDYTAGVDGYRAVVRTNEPGVASQNSVDAVFVVQPPPPAALAQGLPERTHLISNSVK